MEIKAEKERLNYFNRFNLLDRAVKAECKLSGLPDGARVLSLTAKVSPVNVTVTDGSVRWTAKTVFSAVYLGEDGLSLAECGVEFSADMQDERLKTGDKVFLTFKAERYGLKTANGFTVAECYVLASGYAERSDYCDYLTGGEGLLVKNGIKTLCLYQGTFKGPYTAEGEINFDCVVKSVFASDATVCVTRTECSLDRILVDGFATVTILALQKGEKEGIIKKTQEIPFRAEIDAVGLNSSSRAAARAVCKSLKADVIADENGGVSTAMLSVGMELTAYTFGCVEVGYAEDCYSPECEVNLTSSSFPTAELTEVNSFSRNISGEAMSEEAISEDAVYLTTLFTSFETADVQSGGDSVTVSGVAQTTVLVRLGEEGKISSYKLNMPVSETFVGKFGGKVYLDASLADVKGAKKGDKFYLDGTLKVYAYGVNDGETGLIADAEAGEKKTPNDSAISVYYMPEGATLWDASKLAGICGEEIAEFNPDLTFPLADRGRVLVYRQKRTDY